jgi:hypothetical protein
LGEAREEVAALEADQAAAEAEDAAADEDAAEEQCMALRTDGLSIDIDGDYTETLARISAALAKDKEGLRRSVPDPEARQRAADAVMARWFELSEVGGGGIDGAHKRSMEVMASGSPVWANPAFVMSLLLMAFPLMLAVDVFFLNPAAYSGELRVQIVTAILAIIAMVGGYWIGTSFSSFKKDERRA